MRELDCAFKGDSGSPIVDMEVGEMEDLDAALGLLEVRARELGRFENGVEAFPTCGVGGGAGAERESGGGEGLKKLTSRECGHEERVVPFEQKCSRLFGVVPVM